MTFGRLIPAAVRPLRRIRRGFTTSDPDRARLRLATTTIATLVVVALILFALATVTAQPITAVVPGIVVAMIASLAVREPEAGRRAVSILLLIPSSVIAITLGAVVHAVAPLADVVFVIVAVAAVLLRALGPRGTAIGMVAFMSYFLSLFVKTTPAQLPVVAAAVIAAALVTIAMRLLLRPRHADRDLHRMVAALGFRAGRVLDVLVEGVRAGEFDERLRADLRSRVAASGSTATSVEDVLEAAEGRVIQGIGNDELGVRVFDFQLAIENLATTAVHGGLQAGAGPPEREPMASRLRAFADVLRAPMPLVGSVYSSAPESPGEEGAATLARVLDAGYDSWHRVAFPAADDAPERPRASAENPDGRPAGADDDRPALRGAFAALRATTRPLTHGLTGVFDRGGSRRTLQILAA
ncbi:hypothetical protein [Cryobacterium tepidiphilum]|uniref:FUSC family protein n=1 Tax=Cryobacterium tepidiphilum TaxID=2486026 RepID=A0A3M8LFN3_9MICO|nr:hypothetical protein [Cryobacterium tepidiphilum]RNE63622.1 hypothetical protein EEJ31_06525 [Cryobacterium tepidiphilum]